MEITVQPDHSFWYYSQLFQIPLQLIIESNRNKNPENLQVGETVKIPGFIMRRYTIQLHDTLWILAVRNGVPLPALLMTNPGVDPTRLRVGEQINLPTRITWRMIAGKRNYDYEALVTDIRKLLTVYPFIMQGTIGQSVMNKEIPQISIGSGTKKVHVNGSNHANEWITTALLMVFLNDYLLALTNETGIRGRLMLPLYDSTLLVAVPMVNPDGVDLVLHGIPEEERYAEQVLTLNSGSQDFSGWKANINGVDLNNQFPAEWEIEQARKPKSPGPRDFPGYKPLSEPEAIALAQFTEQSDFHRVLAFHSQGEEIYWGFEGFEPPESEIIVNEFARVSGYTAIRYVDSYAGYKDWFIQEWKRPGFTIEVGKGVNPLPLSQFEKIYEENLGILLASLYM